MKPKDKITELSITSELFKKRVQDRILNYQKGPLESFFSFSPHLQWDKVALKGDELIIEKSAKPLDKTSRYAGVSGTIQSKIIEDNGRTILQTRITLDTALAIVMKYTVGVAIGLAGITWLIIDFDIKVLLGLLAVEGFIFGLTPLFQSTALDDLTDYYDEMINELVKK